MSLCPRCDSDRKSWYRTLLKSQTHRCQWPVSIAGSVLNLIAEPNLNLLRLQSPACHSCPHISARICDCLPQSPRQFQRDAAIASEQPMPKGNAGVCRKKRWHAEKVSSYTDRHSRSFKATRSRVLSFSHVFVFRCFGLS